MLGNPSTSGQTMDPVLAELARLRRFTGPPNEFWPAFLAAIARLIRANRGILIVRDSAQPERLKKLSDWTDNGHADRSTLTFLRILPELAGKCVEQGHWSQVIESAPTANAKHVALGIQIALPSGQEKCVAAFLLLNVTEAQVQEALVRLQLAADLPLSYQASHSALQARTDVEKFASVLDVMVLVNAETRFRAAALAFCNGLATRFNFDRASLGWLHQGYVRLQTMSRTERFDKNMSAVQILEAAMEEAMDQDEELLWPAPEGQTLVTRDHERFAREQLSGHLCSVPLRMNDQPVAVLTCERRDHPITFTELQQLRLACDQAIARLFDLKRHDRWFGARWVMVAREKLSKALGPEHTWTKVLTLAGLALLVISMIPIFPYRAEGNFILRGDKVSFLTAPYDGYIKSVEVRPGDLVPSGGALLALNTDDLELEESSAIAEQNRYLREAEKAEAARMLAEMRIARAQADQAKARLDLARYRLNQAVIKTTFDGIVVEGDLRQRLGAPVKQGDSLFKVARIDALYVEAEVKERDVHEILDKVAGEIAFVAQPKLKFPVKVVRVEPAAFPKDKDNVFLVRCEFAGKPQPWWRPGMSGVCKINVEDRTLLWIVTHRTVDFLRLFFWW